MMQIKEKWIHVSRSYSAESIEFVGTFSVHFIAFWVVALTFTVIDVCNPIFLRRFKVRPASKQPNWEAIRKGFYGTLSNQALTIGLHFLQLFLLRRLTQWRSAYRIEEALPSLAEVTWSIILCALGREILYYYVHRLLHQPFLYRRFHKQHHQFLTPVAVASESAHPVEHIFSNILPIIAPAIFLRTHIVTFWLFMAMGVAQATMAHCGYDMFSVGGWSPKVHDLHHQLFNVNYGLFGLLDWLHGTRYTGHNKME